jgi:hypothetical protein
MSELTTCVRCHVPTKNARTVPWDDDPLDLAILCAPCFGAFERWRAWRSFVDVAEQRASHVVVMSARPWAK